VLTVYVTTVRHKTSYCTTTPYHSHELYMYNVLLYNFLGERYYITFALRHEPSVCRLSVVCNVVALYTEV